MHLCAERDHIGSLKSAVVGVVTPQKLANATNQGSFFFSVSKSKPFYHSNCCP